MNEVDKLLSHSFDEIKGSSLVIELLRLALKYFGSGYTTCEKEYKQYYEQLKTLKTDNMEPVKKNLLEKKYILRGSSLLYYNNTHFNNDTLTDQIAESAIKKFPALIGIFLNEKERKVLELKSNAGQAIVEAESEVLKTDAEPEVETDSSPATKPEEKEEPKPKAKK